MEREKFIQVVSQALGRDRGSVAPVYPPLQETPDGIAERAAKVWAKLENRTSTLADRFLQVSKARGWRVFRAAGTEAALDYIRELASARGCTSVVRSDQDVFRTVPVDGTLQGLGVRVTVMARSSGVSSEEQRTRAAEADMGITGADYAIAETGSVALLARPGTSRLVSLVPPIHVALVLPGQIIEDLDDLLVLRRSAYYSDGMDMGRYLNLITGPSRTADIEQKLVVGAHGPKEAHLVLVE